MEPIFSKKKKHHYIQQAFLNNFGIDSHVYVFDKNKNEVRHNNIEDVFEENHFYRIPLTKHYDSMSKEEKDKINKDIIARFGKPFEKLNEKEKNQAEEWFEDFFAEGIEPVFSSTIKELRSNIGEVIIGLRLNPITDKIRYNLSTCLAFYYSRTRFFRDSLTKGLEDTFKQIALMEAQYKGIDLNDESFKVSFTKEQSKIYHIGFLGKVMDDDSLIEAIFTRKWTFIINKTDVPFIFSDNVLTIKLTVEQPDFYGVGIKSIGAEIYFPISPQIMMVLNDPITFKQINNGSCFLVKDKNKINNLNSFIADHCYKYCVSNDGNYLTELTRASKNYK